MWIREISPPGCITTIHTYSHVAILATGAVSASCLQHIINKRANIYHFWIAKDHQTPYGSEVWNIVSQLSKRQMVLHDTGTMGRPNAAYMIPKAAEEYKIDAVFAVSNDF
jgi:hypothetical protein